MAVLAPDPQSEDTAERFERDTVRSGGGINDPEMVRLFLKGSPVILDKLAAYGVAFKKLGERFMKKRAPGHSVARSFSTDFSSYPYLTRGLSLTVPLLNYARRSGVRIVDYAPVIRLLVSDGRMCGAVALGKKTETVLLFRTGSVVLAAGGGGRLFARSNNTVDITGDAYGLAYDAGATLRDMEFVQFYPTMMFAPLKVTISSPLFGEGAFLRNAEGERFMANYAPEADMATRDIMTRAMFSEVQAGRGQAGNVFMDCRAIPRDTLTTKFAELLRLLAKAHIDPSRDLIPISPATHFFMGGVAIDSHCQTTVPGLLACGEAVGGLHGANRLGGNALSETVVFGTIAGSQAAAQKTGALPEPPEFHLEALRTGRRSPKSLQRELRELTWRHLSIVRSQKSAAQAMEALDHMRAALGQLAIESVHDLVAFYEVRNMLTTARLIASGAMRRTESRGGHFRSDHSQADDANFKGNIYQRREGGAAQIEFRFSGSRRLPEN
jgi:succinate dehydrogenase/fumarate reductase flavoprotein subunit